ncbi:MAG TPA: 16S rRNA (guanine(966)-N(2))-methyltransferase RsmD [Burkholderiaceae bacterium]|nr:16S rRNA (guanine(966)-N(2))-methyltransferase RsmD [Burkholderiaceae bacterium]
MNKRLRHSTTPAATRSPAGRIRIIGGQFRRTPIAVIAAAGLRPTPDRVRETVFNWLEHLLGDRDGIRALDLFAGTGVLGFEMASRGAHRVVLVESNARTAQALRALQRRLAAPTVQVLQADWRLALTRLAPERFDVIFLDPPYGSGILDRALGAVRPLLAPGGLIYAEAPRPLEAVCLAEQGWELLRANKAGGVYFHLLQERSC